MIFERDLKEIKLNRSPPSLPITDTMGRAGRRRLVRVILVLAIADTIAGLIENKTIHDVDNKLLETRRRSRKRSRSTSSDSADKRSSDDSDGSLGISTSSSSSSDEDNRWKPKSTEERKGWRKWHRKCPKCPEDMMKKWRDKSINWICGGFQRARRTFKSECMMHYRNCQDGTMFVKIHDYRCANGTSHGAHFFYDYGRDSQDSKDSTSSSSAMSSESSLEFMKGA